MTPSHLPKPLYQFPLPPAESESSSCSTSLPTFDTVYLWWILLWFYQYIYHVLCIYLITYKATSSFMCLLGSHVISDLFLRNILFCPLDIKSLHKFFLWWQLIYSVGFCFYFIFNFIAFELAFLSLNVLLCFTGLCIVSSKVNTCLWGQDFCLFGILLFPSAWKSAWYRVIIHKYCCKSKFIDK